MRGESEQVIYLKDYEPSPYLIERVSLDVRIAPDKAGRSEGMAPGVTLREGTDTTQGASDREGEGTGAGGSGDGTGAGGAGDGKGGGGGTRPSVVQSTTLTQKDFPKEVRKAWPSGGAVYVAIRVQVDGRATDCKVNRGIDPNIDAWVCRLVEQKVRFTPARDAQGRPYVAWYGYVQYAIF